MNKKGIIAGVVVLVVVAAAAVYFMLGGKGLDSIIAPAATSQGSLRELFTKGGSQKCTVTSSTDTSNSSGTVYIGIGKMRGDFTSTTQGKTVKSHMIVMDGISYVWSDGLAQGFKMSFDVNDTSSNISNEGVNSSAAMNYSCQYWAPNTIQFELPGGINFQDVSAMVPTAVGAGAATETSTTAKGTAAQCAACNQITNAQSKAQCLVALSCQ